MCQTTSRGSALFGQAGTVGSTAVRAHDACCQGQGLVTAQEQLNIFPRQADQEALKPKPSTLQMDVLEQQGTTATALPHTQL